MKASGAPSSVEVGKIVEPRHQGGAKQNGKAEKFEKAFADSALRQRGLQVGKSADEESELGEAIGSLGPKNAADPHRGSLHRAWRKLALETDANTTTDRIRSNAAASEAGNSGCSVAAHQVTAALPVALPWQERVGAGDADHSEPRAESSDAEKFTVPGHRKLLLSISVNSNEWDLGHQNPESAEEIVSFPQAKVLSEEVNFAPARSLNSGQHVDEAAPSTGPHPKDRVDSLRRDPGESIPNSDELGAREAAVTAATDGAAPTDSDSAMRPTLSAPSVQVLDGLLGKGEQTGELVLRLASSAAQLDEKAPFTPFVRTIKLQLAPESLGLVNVVLARGEASLRIRLEAETGETRGALLADRDKISRQLEASGLRVDELVVMRLGDTGNTSLSDLRSSTASGWANESNAGHRSDQGQPRQSGRGWAEDRTSGAKPDEPNLGQTDAQPRSNSDRFLGRRTLRSV